MQYGWRDCPADVRGQAEKLTQALKALLSYQLVGVYLHGSLPFGSLNPALSDIDLLVVVGQNLTVEQKREVALLLLQTSRQPCPVEITFVTESALHSGEYPLAFTFHYSEAWRERITSQLESEEWQQWNDQEQRDPDLAGQVAITARHGIVLTGEPIKRVLPELPSEQITASFRQDVGGALGEIEKYPVYGVLNPCRALYYLRTGRFCSKDEGGAWALEVLPETVHPVIERALARYRGQSVDTAVDRERLREFAEVIKAEIER